MTDTLNSDELDEALAAEYVLGVQSLIERTETHKRMQSDRAFALRVQAWENRLAELNDDFAPVPAPDLWPTIEARLFPTEQPATGLRQWLRMIINARWVMGASVALLACVFVGFFLVAPAKPDLIAMLQAKDASLTYQAAFQDGQLEVERVTGEAAPFGLVHQLWVIEPGGVPISLGLLETANLRLAYPVPPNGSVIAISVEPAGGSPTGAPTGPVILSAQIAI